MRLEVDRNRFFWGEIHLHHRPSCEDSGNSCWNRCIILYFFVIVLIFLVSQLPCDYFYLLNLRIFLEFLDDSIIFCFIKSIEPQDLLFKLSIMIDLWALRGNIMNILLCCLVLELKGCLWLENIWFSCNDQRIDVVGSLQLFVDDLVDFFWFFIKLV